MSEIKGDLLKKYVYKIRALECNIAAINSKDLKHKGYIINLNYYNNLKNKNDF